MTVNHSVPQQSPRIEGKHYAGKHQHSDGEEWHVQRSLYSVERYRGWKDLACAVLQANVHLINVWWQLYGEWPWPILKVMLVKNLKDVRWEVENSTDFYLRWSVHASSVDRDVNAGPVSQIWLRQWFQTLNIYVLHLHLHHGYIFTRSRSWSLKGELDLFLRSRRQNYLIFLSFRIRPICVERQEIKKFYLPQICIY